VQRSVQAGRQGLSETDYGELLNFQNSDQFTDREKTALTYTSAIVWNSDIADDALWEKLHRHFSIPELVELGFFVALTFGQQRWIKTLALGHQELMADNAVGLAAPPAGE
jgi:alkylhydroperoxidase family enzyme